MNGRAASIVRWTRNISAGRDGGRCHSPYRHQLWETEDSRLTARIVTKRVVLTRLNELALDR